MRDNEQNCLSPAHYLRHSALVMSSGGKAPRIIKTARRSDHQASCELVPAVPSPPPCQPYRDNRPRSHPPHFASTASLPTHPPPQSIKMRRLAPTSPPFVLAIFIPPHLYDSRTTIRIESSCFLKDKQSSAYLVKHISHPDFLC
jgi:hypothetical protein